MMTTSDAVNDPGRVGAAARRNTAGIDLRPAPAHRWRFFVYSAIGLAMFFLTVEIGGESTILVDHALSAVMWVLGPTVPWVVVALVLLGTVRPFVTGSWRRSGLRTVFAIANVVGLVVAIYHPRGRAVHRGAHLRRPARGAARIGRGLLRLDGEAAPARPER